MSVQAFAHAFVRASQASGSDDDAQATAPLDEHSRSPFAMLPHTSFSGSHFPQGVFLSATPADAAFVARLKADLEARGSVVESTANTPDQQNAVQQAIRVAQLVLVVISPHTRSSHTVKEHLQIASMYERPLVFVWAAGDEIAEALPEAWGNMAVIDLIDARQTRYETALNELVAYLDAELSVTTPLEPEPGERQGEPRNPYKGLSAFTQDDAADFFGRDALIQELVETMQGMLPSALSGTPGTRLLTVMGPSGSGKSSMVMAGLLPRLQSGALPGSNQWVYLKPMLPGQHPIDALTLLLSSHFPARSLKTIREDLEDDAARGLHLLATALVHQPDTKVVLLIDQFEELFTQTSTEEERRHFIDLLLTAVTQPRGPVIVILTLRADFYDRLTNYPELALLIKEHHELVLPMGIQDLRAVIEHPAALPDVQLTFEGNLVGDLLFEMQGQAGALPLLQFTLEQLFQRRNGHLLTLQAYQEIGGVKGALAKQAEDTYRALPSEEHRKLARALFLRLIDPGITEQDTTRRRAALSELVLSTPEQTELLQQVTTCFLAARLLTTNEIAGTPTIEVSHEALIREWTRLSDWLHEAREDVHLLQAISMDATEWQRRGKPRDRLYRGSQLQEAKTWATRNTPSQNEVAFLRASAAHRVGTRVSMIAVFLLLVSIIGWQAQQLLLSGITTLTYGIIPTLTTVTTLNDDEAGSLRQLVATARPGSTITFATGLRGRIVLTSELVIKKNLTIRGPGAGILSITGSGDFNVVFVKQGVTATISDLAFNGTRQTETGSGIIINDGTLTLTNSMISGNTTLNGAGGISNAGTLTLTNSTISDNTTLDAYGGGIGNYGGSITVSNSRISGNTAFAGGGIFNNGGPLTLSNSMVFGNSTSDNRKPVLGNGGGIFNVNGGTLTLINSTVSDNTAGYGGGIDNGYSGNREGVTFDSGGTLTLTNSTISDNRAMHGAGIITNAGSSAALSFCTIYGNSATGKGGGIMIVNIGSNKPNPVAIGNSLVAANHAASNPDIVGTLTSSGYNLFQDNSGATFDPATSTQHGTDKIVSVNDLSKLFADPVRLQDNGGPTWTYALAPGSPALDQIPLDACHINGITTDQRGMKRPDGNETACDIGAYEYVDSPT
jgi:hypothetical protein